jgi:hypothetical protein
MNNVDEAEIQRRQVYWSEHWQDFQCEVVIHKAKSANAHVGAFDSFGGSLGLFGSIPVPMHATEVDRGNFYFHDGCAWVNGQYRTYCWRITDVMITIYNNGTGAEMRAPGKEVVTILGPVGAALAGAANAYGVLKP